MRYEPTPDTMIESKQLQQSPTKQVRSLLKQLSKSRRRSTLSHVSTDFAPASPATVQISPSSSQSPSPASARRAGLSYSSSAEARRDREAKNLRTVLEGVKKDSKKSQQRRLSSLSPARRSSTETRHVADLGALFSVLPNSLIYAKDLDELGTRSSNASAPNRPFGV